MTNQAAQTMPELPDPAFVTPDDNLYTVHQMRAMYQQGYAAALSQTAGVAEGFVVVPARLTAENGAKGLLSGEFHERSFHTCDECDGEGYDDSGDACEVCDGSCTIEQKVTVSWDNIKAIHRRMVEHFAAMLAAAPAASGAHPDALPDGTLSKSTAKRVTALAAASVSERARALMAQAYRDGGYPHAAGTLEAGVIDSVDSCALRALEQALTQHRGAMEPIAWAATDYQADGPITQYTSDRYAAAYYQSIGLDVRPLYTTTPQPSADAARELVKRILNWQPLTSLNKADRLYQILIAAGIPFESVTDELESLLSGGSHA